MIKNYNFCFLEEIASPVFFENKIDAIRQSYRSFKKQEIPPNFERSTMEMRRAILSYIDSLLQYFSRKWVLFEDVIILYINGSDMCCF